MEGYKSILKNESTFFDTYSSDNKYINQLISTSDDVTMEISEFSIIDLDDNGIPEIVLRVSIIDGIDVYYAILSYKENQVYCYSLPDRAFSELKTDGTFHFTNSASNHGYGKIDFTKAVTDSIDLVDAFTYKTVFRKSAQTFYFFNI